MKKQAPPTPRAAALLQSSSRFSAVATLAWQHIAGNSPRLVSAARVAAPLVPPAAPGARRVAPESQRLAEPVAPAAAPETIRQVGWREVDQAVGMSTKHKYSIFGFGFGPKVPVFETEKVKLPVYQETNRKKRYYAVVKVTDIARIRREGLLPASVYPGKKTTEQTIEHLNTNGYLQFFASEAAARRHAQDSGASNYTVLPFVMPEYQELIPHSAAPTTTGQAPSFSRAALRTTHGVSPELIR